MRRTGEKSGYRRFFTELRGKRAENEHTEKQTSLHSHRAKVKSRRVAKNGIQGSQAWVLTTTNRIPRNQQFTSPSHDSWITSYETET